MTIYSNCKEIMYRSLPCEDVDQKPVYFNSCCQQFSGDGVTGGTSKLWDQDTPKSSGGQVTSKK